MTESVWWVEILSVNTVSCDSWLRIVSDLVLKILGPHYGKKKKQNGPFVLDMHCAVLYTFHSVVKRCTVRRNYGTARVLLCEHMQLKVPDRLYQIDPPFLKKKIWKKHFYSARHHRGYFWIRFLTSTWLSCKHLGNWHNLKQSSNSDSCRKPRYRRSGWPNSFNMINAEYNWQK